MQNLAIKEVKADGTIVVFGPGVVFGGRDTDGDSFTKQTNFQIDFVPNKPVFYRHRSDPNVKERIGTVTDIQTKDEGIWFEAQLNNSTRYLKSIKRLIDLGVMGYSTGTAPQLINKKESGEIETWPIVELSITPVPAEPRTLGIQAIKEIGQALVELETIEAEALVVETKEEVSDTEENEDKKTVVESEVQAETQQTSEDTVTVEDESVLDKSNKKESKIENRNIGVIMADERTLDERINDVLSQFTIKQEETDKNVKDLSDGLSKLLAQLEKNPKVMGAGFITQDGGDADKNVKSFGDFLMAVYRKDAKRLNTVYKSTKDLGEGTGAGGGYLVPEEYSTSLLQTAHMNNQVLSRVQTIPVTLAAGRWPALDQYITPTAGSGQTATAAGVKTTPVDAGDTLTKTEPSFEMLEWRLHKVGGYTEVDNELIDDSPMSVEALLRGLFVVAIGAKNERNILRGSGAGEPLGILNSTAIVNVTPGTDNAFTWPDVGNMYAKFRSAGGSPVWVIHPSVWPDIMGMETTNGGAVWQANLAANSSGQGLNGIPIITSEHLPQANSSGDVVLADLSGYLMWQRSGISIDFSEHAAFTADQGTWRFTQRTDGKPWLRYPITLADPQGSYQVSPFVVHND